MKLTIFGLTVFAGAALVIAGLHGQLDWVNTPGGHAALGWLLLAVLVIVLACLGIRTAHRDRLKWEAEELDANEEWFERIHEQAPVRRITQADRDRESDRLWRELEQTSDYPPQVEPAAVPEVFKPAWPQPLSPRLVDHPWAAAQPMPARYWLGDPKPMAEVTSYTGAAAWTAEAFRSGLPIADPGVVDAPVSPAAPPVYRPRHDAEHPRPPAHVIGYNRVAARVLNEATGSFRVVRSETVLVGAGAS
jgi:hypothetical protein